MITTILFIVLGSILGAFTGILRIITGVVIPSSFEIYLYNLLEPMIYLRGLFNLAALMEVVGWLLSASVYLILFVIFRWLWGHIPWVGISHKENKLFDEHGRRKNKTE